MVAVFDDFSIVGFDFKAAKAANGVVTLAKADGYGGVYYQGGNINVEDKYGNVIGKEYIEKYYLLMVDGYGHSRVLYYRADDKEYRPNWSSENHNGWAQYTVTTTGVHVEYNSSQVYDFVFYYDNNLLFVKCTTGVLKETTYPKVGYTGRRRSRPLLQLHRQRVKRRGSGAQSQTRLDGHVQGHAVCRGV